MLIAVRVHVVIVQRALNRFGEDHARIVLILTRRGSFLDWWDRVWSSIVRPFVRYRLHNEPL